MSSLEKLSHDPIQPTKLVLIYLSGGVVLVDMKGRLFSVFSSLFLYMFAFAFTSVALAQTVADVDARANVETNADVETVELSGQVGVSVMLDGALEGINNAVDGSIRSSTWTQTGGPFKFSINEGNTITITPPIPGTYEFELIVSESGEERLAKKVTILVGAESNMRADTRAGDRDETNRAEDESDTDETRSAPSLVDGAEPVLVSANIFNEDGVTLRARVSEDIDGNGGLDRTNVVLIGDSDSDLSTFVDLKVSGVTVRGWDPAKKEEVIAKAAASREINTLSDFGNFVVDVTLENENIVEITTDKDVTEVIYTTTVYLFGFIPKQVTAVARAESEGEVSIDYPWYGFLARKGKQSDIEFLTLRIRGENDRIIVAGART